jgi:dTDP-4-dehydrorhamnose reductase
MPDSITILVTGANGQLGKELKQVSAVYPRTCDTELNFVFLSREDLPIHHFETVRRYFDVYKPAFLINCAAYTAVDRAEQEKDLAMQVNGEAPGVLAAICKERVCRFIHISTDYVFDGTATSPYKEDAITHPQSVYGKSKREGEKQALQFNADTIIIRTSWVYSEFGKNFVKTMMKLMSEREEIKVVNDQVGAPTYAADLAEAILQIIIFSIQHPTLNINGVYHFSNKGVISWYDFAVAIKELSGSKCKIHPIPTSEYPTPAKRPAYSVLDTAKIQQIPGIRIKNWKASLTACIDKIK